jgi:uncharacterized membrane protein
MLYNVLLFVHIVAAIVWVGGAIMINVLATRAVASGDPVRMATVAKETSGVGQRIIAPSALILLAMGFWMVAVNDGWTIGQAWIILALVGFGITFLTGALFFGPQALRIGKAIDEGRPTDPDVQRRIRSVVALGRFDLLLLVLIVADMVFKPGF